MADIQSSNNLEVQTYRNRPVSIWHLFAGIIMAILGVYVWFNPVATMVALALYLGIIFIIIGVGYVAASFNNDSGWDMFVGVLDILVGVIFVGNLGVTAASLPIIFALWCLAVGVIQLVVAYKFKKAGMSWGWTLTSGVLGIIFAFLILTYPALGVITITALMGAYILLYGVLEIAEYTTNNRNLVINANDQL